MPPSCRCRLPSAMFLYALVLLANYGNRSFAFVARQSFPVPKRISLSPRSFGLSQRLVSHAIGRSGHGTIRLQQTVVDTTAEQVTDSSTNSDDEDDLTGWLLEKSNQGFLYYLDVILVGAGAAGVGVSHALLRGGMDPTKLLLIDQGPRVGHSFRQWHANTTRFISPSWAGYPFGIQDLNAVVPDTTVGGSQHPTGDEYADYLERMVSNNTVPLMLNTTITSIERVMPQGCFVIKTDLPKVFIANYVVWCGGEWHSPRRLPEERFPKDASVHYKDANIARLLEQHSANSDSDGRVVLVGGGEAGADLGVALAKRGAKVLIVESDSDTDDGVLDPSRNLSPITRERLAGVRDAIEVRTGTECVGARRRGDVVTVTLRSTSDPGDTEVVTTGADLVLCTGFDSSSNPLVKSIFSFSDEGNPVVTPEHDESEKTDNLFLAGPMLVHKVTCEDGDDDGDDIIFCFVYKYRARFAVVASEIIRRHVQDQTLILEENAGELNEDQEAQFRDDLQDILAKREAMRDHYASRGMMLTDLSCAQLACGMTANDVPNYGYDSSCACAPGDTADCETC